MCIRDSTTRVDTDRLARIQTPILLVAGERDDVAQGAAVLADRIPTARLVVIPGRAHMGTVPARQFKEAVLEFLAETSGACAPLSPTLPPKGGGGLAGAVVVADSVLGSRDCDGGRHNRDRPVRLEHRQLDFLHVHDAVLAHRHLHLSLVDTLALHHIV